MKAFTCTRGSLRHTIVFRAIALLLLTISMPMARAQPEEDPGLPPVFDMAACYLLVQETGRMIAWARWEVGAPEDKVVAHFEDDTPEWVVDLTNRWIADAYHWEVTDAQVRQWAGELGDASASSPLDGLTTPETIAIWLRRIAQQCREQHA